MAEKIGSNIQSLSAQRNLRETRRALATSFARLSSGVRLNSAADDAAGLSISSRLSGQIRSLNQAVRNANDGISMAQTADAALGESSSILERIRELSVQAGNATYTDADRAAIQGEIDQLSGELDRIAGSTEFNNQALLDGSLQDRTFQIGAQAGQTVSISLADSGASQLGAEARATGDAAVSADALSGADADLTLNGVTIGGSVDDGVSTVGADSSALAKANAINAQSNETGVTAEAEATSFSGQAVSAGNLGAGALSINGTDIGAVDVQDDDANGALVSAINARSGETGVTAERVDLGVDNDGDGSNDFAIQLSAEDGRNIDIQHNADGDADTTGLFVDNDGDGARGAGDEVNHTQRGELTLSSDEEIVIGGTDPASLGFSGDEDLSVQSSSTVATLSVSSSQSASDSIAVIDRAISQVARRRSRVGALQNRLQGSMANLSTVATNLSGARSGITDTDMAAETARKIQAQIIGNAGTAVMAQANVAPTTVLALLS